PGPVRRSYCGDPRLAGLTQRLDHGGVRRRCAPVLRGAAPRRDSAPVPACARALASCGGLDLARARALLVVVAEPARAVVAGDLWYRLLDPGGHLDLRRQSATDSGR